MNYILNSLWTKFFCLWRVWPKLLTLCFPLTNLWHTLIFPLCHCQLDWFFFFTPLVLLPLNEQCVSFFVNVEQWLIEARLLLTLWISKKVSKIIYYFHLFLSRCSPWPQHEVRPAAGQPERVLPRGPPAVSLPELRLAAGGWDLQRRPWGHVCLRGICRHIFCR